MSFTPPSQSFQGLWPLMEGHNPAQRLNHKEWQPFSRMENQGRVVRGYQGYLPHQKHQAFHILQCEHLRLLENLPTPYGAIADTTHQISVWYCVRDKPGIFNSLFRGRFNMAIAPYISDAMAVELTEFLAYMLMNSENYRQELFLNDHSDRFWRWAIIDRIRSITTSGITTEDAS